MTGTSSVPEPTFGPNGFVAPPEADILVGVLADTNAAYGGGMNPDLETPQGQFASSETAIIGNKNDQFVFLTNQFDPATNSGRWQDGVANIYDITRNPAQSTTVVATLTGLAGVIIPAGALAQDVDGNNYQCTEAGVIGLDGTASLTFACVATGPIQCPVASLTKIYRAIPGWDTITNPGAGVIGNDVESRADFEFRRQQLLAKNSVGQLTSVLGAVLSVPGVLDAYVTENDTGSPATIGGFSVAAHSLYVAAAGGDAQAVGEAIWSKKAPGCAYNGNTTITVTDTDGYIVPYPTYSVTFEIPTADAVLFAVSIKSNTLVPANATALIQAVIIAAFSGSDGGARARIGSTIFASRYYAGVALLGAWAEIISIQVGAQNAPTVSMTASIAGANMTVSAISSGVLAVGQTIIGSTVLDGTRIVSQTSGSPGSTGVYVVTNVQTVTSRAMVAALANLNSVTMQIDQAPTISAANIVVTYV